MKVDSAILKLLSLDASKAKLGSASGGGMSSASTSKITATLPDGSSKDFFVKTGSGKKAEIMFEGEHASLSAIHNTVPLLCPQSYGHGKLEDDPGKSFLVTDFLDFSGRRTGSSSNSTMSLAQKMAKLHTTPAPIPKSYDKPMFGFPSVTCCGDTPQPNKFHDSWAHFYAEERLRFIARESEKNNGSDKELSDLIETTADKVVPRLLGDRHLNGGKGVMPVVVHGDLWSGNAAVGSIAGQTEPQDVVFDSSACYAHNEFDFGIMRMFGGFGSSFFNEYHKLCPKTEPVAEYEDRISLYELYHHLNHHALFGGGYRSGAVRIMQNLIRKYGKAAKEEL